MRTLLLNVSFWLLAIVPAVASPDGDLCLRLWVKLEAKPEGFVALASDKSWKPTELVDFTSNSNLGVSSKSGGEKGWCVALQPNGSWTWNFSDGKGRLDYLPTWEHQPIADGKWHFLAFSMDHEKKEARLYRDGRNVAIYSTSGVGGVPSDVVQARSSLGEGLQLEDVVISKRLLGADEIRAEWLERGGQAVPSGSLEQSPKELRVLAWNIWHGGRRDGREEGLRKTIEIIRRSGADVVAMQETYGSGPIIADTLGWFFYLRSSNLSVLSRYPIQDTHDLYQSFRLGAVTIEPSPGQFVRVCSLWINHLPSYGSRIREGGAEAEELIAAEWKTRGKEMRDILGTLTPLMEETDRIPLIVAGDFNSPSHLDWIDSNREIHGGLVVDWPVSRQMAEAGFTDAFRRRHPDPLSKPGRSWSPRFTESWQDRIDYIYYRGAALAVRESAMLDQHEDGWPSDHGAVVATLDLTLAEETR